MVPCARVWVLIQGYTPWRSIGLYLGFFAINTLGVQMSFQASDPSQKSPKNTGNETIWYPKWFVLEKQLVSNCGIFGYLYMFDFQWYSLKRSWCKPDFDLNKNISKHRKSNQWKTNLEYVFPFSGISIDSFLEILMKFLRVHDRFRPHFKKIISILKILMDILRFEDH